MVVSLKKDKEGEKEPYRLEFSVDGDGNVADNANAYPTLIRPGEGTMPEQEITKQVKFAPSDELKALIKAEHLAAVNAELAR